jgi:hypothetical protein
MLYSPDELTTERRKTHRALMARQVTARFEAEEPFRLSLVNISRQGFLASVDRPMLAGMVIQLANNPAYSAEVVRVSDGMIACRFAKTIDPFALIHLAGEDGAAQAD